jgi:tryptophan synthase alpha chain
MSRIADAFAGESGPLLIAYLVAGDPDPETCETLVRTVIEAGADIVELGMPFSDPVADGPTIQRAGERALQGGMTVGGLWSTVRRMRDRTEVPIVILTYANPVVRRGIERFYGEAASAGADGVIIVDMPPEEADGAIAAARIHGIDQIFLVAETTSDERLAAILACTPGFVYLVSTRGVTGARKELPPSAYVLVDRVRRQQAGIPLAVGFGISTPAQARSLAEAGADGMIGGSAIVRLVEEHLGDTERMLAEVGRYVGEMKDGLRGGG